MGETMVRAAHRPMPVKMAYLMRTLVLTLLGKWLMAQGAKRDNADWGGYKGSLIANSDYRKFDEVLRMVIAGTAAQRQNLRTFLERQHRAGRLVFGLNAAPTALLTCIVTNYDKEHVHFLDGSRGGYALAAREMKRQLAASPRVVW